MLFALVLFKFVLFFWVSLSLGSSEKQRGRRPIVFGERHVLLSFNSLAIFGILRFWQQFFGRKFTVETFRQQFTDR